MEEIGFGDKEVKSRIKFWMQALLQTTIFINVLIDGHEIILSFDMNQDNTLTTNMMKNYTEVTLNCFDNLKVRYNVGNADNAQSILNSIYRGFTPAFLWQR